MLLRYTSIRKEIKQVTATTKPLCISTRGICVIDAIKWYKITYSYVYGEDDYDVVRDW